MVCPSSAEMPEETGRYQLLGENGHGGMGAVLKGRDPHLGRDLAVKILLEEHRNDPDLVRRFTEEAQIGGQLQHPGIVPVYEVGQFGDGRPYFTMKLVKGRTLSALLKERTGPAHDLPRFLGIFEQVCQTMAYAHARGVIHRDLKPPNIMVGAFGEVQVMDWGLAKVLPQGEAADEARPDPDVVAVSVIRTVRSDSDADKSRRGSVMGTLAYMAPEQANGDVESIDERADVFGLGSILCEVLTGRPAYTGPSADAIHRKAKRGETGDALRRLNGCGADGELAALAGHCLAADPEGRPRDAGEVARRMTGYLTGVQDRLKAAELARAAEEARAEEAQATAAAAERARAAEEARAEQAQAAAIAAEGRARAERQARRMTVGLAASLLIASTLGAAGWTWIERDRAVRVAARSAQVNTALQEATGLMGQAQSAAVGDLVAWTKALAAAEKARELLDPGLGVSLRRQVESLLSTVTSEKEEAEAAARVAESQGLLLDKLVDIRSAKTDDPDGTISDRDYSAAFRDAGIDVTALAPTEVGARIKALPATVAAALAAALDDWASVRRSRRYDRPGALKLSQAAIAADPDPWRAGLRRALDLEDRAAQAKALRDLAATTKPENAPAVDLDLLGTALSEVGEPMAAEDVLRDGRQRFPGDVWLNYDLAHFLEPLSRGEEAVRYYSIARALRPETAHALAHVLEGKGESVEAIAVLRDLVRLRPNNGRHWGCYGRLLKERGDRAGSKAALEKAITILRQRIQLKPDDSYAHFSLGRALDDQGNLEDAVAEFRTALRLRPGYAEAHHELGMVLSDLGKSAEAIAEYREAIRLKPDSAYTHNSLGIALTNQGKLDEAIAECRKAIRLMPDDAYAHNSLGNALKDQDKLAEALAEYKTAIRIKPDYAGAHVNLGSVLQKQGKPAEAIAEYKQAMHLKPDYANPHIKLGYLLYEQGKIEEASAEFNEAVRLEPANAVAHYGLGTHLIARKKYGDEAIAEFHQAIRLKPDYADAHFGLGLAVYKQGKIEEAYTEYKEAVHLVPTNAIAHYELGTHLLLQRKYDEAITVFHKALRLKPDHAEAHTNLGIALQEQGRLAEATAEYHEAIRLKPGLAEPHCALGSLLQSQGKTEEAAAEYRAAIHIKPDYALAHHNLGHVLSHQGKLAEAIAEFRAAIRIKSDDAHVHRDVGNALKHQGNLGAATTAYREAVRLEPTDAGFHDDLGIALRDGGKLDEAIAECHLAIRLKPEFAHAHNTLGNALRDQGKLDEAIAEYRLAIRLKPDFAIGHSNLGNALRDQGKLDEAIAEYRDAIRFKPDLADPHSGLAHALRDEGKLADAIVEYREAIRLKTETRQAHANLGNSLRDQGNLADASIAFRQAFRLKPDLAAFHTNLGAALHAQGKQEEAIAEYREAIRLKPDFAGAHNNLAWALVLSRKRPQREYDEGLAHARKAVELAKKGVNSHSTLALAEYRSGHWTESLAASERAMALQKGPYAYDWFFQAMARWQKGDKDEARKCFDKAVVWTKANDPKNVELRQFWTEAAELLGQPGPASPAASATKKPIERM